MLPEFLICPKCHAFIQLGETVRSGDVYPCENCQHIMGQDELKKYGMSIEDVDLSIEPLEWMKIHEPIYEKTTDTIKAAILTMEMKLRLIYFMGQMDGLLEIDGKDFVLEPDDSIIQFPNKNKNRKFG